MNEEMKRTRELIKINFDKTKTILNEMGIDDIAIVGTMLYYLTEIHLEQAGLSETIDLFETVLLNLDEIQDSLDLKNKIDNFKDLGDL